MWVIFALNCMVAGASFFVYDCRFEPVILCVIYCFLTSKIGDMSLRGAKEQYKFEIITNDYEALSQEIIKKLYHSATVIPARGMYSGRETDMLICIINKPQIAQMQEIVSHYPGSFAYVGSVNEVLGNFKGKGDIERRQRLQEQQEHIK